VNLPITRLFVLVLAMFVGVVGFTSYWSVIDAEELQEHPGNRRVLLEEAQIARGTIRTIDGTVVAESFQEGVGEEQIYVRRYPQGDLLGHPVGYYFLERGRSGIELSEDDLLAGRDPEFVSILDQLEGQAQEGDDLTITIDAEAQRTAFEALGGQAGSVVAIEPATGAVRVMVSAPPYDPNSVPDQFDELNRAPDSPLFNRATQSGYPPGSSFKVVAATAALDSGEFTPDSVVNGDSPVTISGVPLQNAGGQSFGPISLTDALTNSVNTVWAQVGEQLGTETLYEYMDRFGLNSRPPLDYPPSQMRASGVYEGDKLLDASDSIDIGRVAIGQERLAVTPLQMAMIAAAVANGGELMEPTFLQSVTDPDGRVTEELDPEVHSTVMSEETAATLAQMMSNVVEEGTGTAAALSGIDVAGKTGTAERDVTAGINQAWFIGFAPVGDPQVAVAATVERTSGTGGEVAGPIARQVMEALLGE
jgi:peptidoglycan glycosyltransferase